MKLDKRTVLGRKIKYWQEVIKSNWFGPMILLAILLGLVFGSWSWKYFNHSQKTSPKPQGLTMIQEVKAEQPSEEYYRETPLRYLRYRGQQLGIDEYTITKFISVMKCESGLRPDAVGKNTNGTFDFGITQINDVHKDISRYDRLDFIKNIDYGYKLFLEQGFRPWTCAKKLGIR